MSIDKIKIDSALEKFFSEDENITEVEVEKAYTELSEDEQSAYDAVIAEVTKSTLITGMIDGSVSKEDAAEIMKDFTDEEQKEIETEVAEGIASKASNEEAPKEEAPAPAEVPAESAGEAVSEEKPADKVEVPAVVEAEALAEPVTKSDVVVAEEVVTKAQVESFSKAIDVFQKTISDLTSKVNELETANSIKVGELEKSIKEQRDAIEAVNKYVAARKSIASYQILEKTFQTADSATPSTFNDLVTKLMDDQKLDFQTAYKQAKREIENQ